MTANDVRNDTTLTLRRLGWLEVRVLGTDGKPAADATVFLAGSTLWPARRSQTDAQEATRIVGLLKDSYDVRATRGSLVSETVYGHRLERGAHETLTLQLVPGRMVTALVTDGDDIPVAFSDDGRTLIVEQSESNGTYPLKRMSLPPPGKQELVLPDDSDGAVVSPDNKYIAYVSERTGEVYVLPLVGGGVPERVSTGGGEAVAWSANSRELYYARPPEILAVTLGQEGPRLRPMGERVWARVNQSWPQQRAFAIGKDGRILIALPKEPVIPQIRVILGWDQEIAQKLRR